MRVFKFGGASVKDAASVKNLVEILKHSGEGQLIVVVSAMGKTTNNIEEYLGKIRENKPEAADMFQIISSYHRNIINELFTNDDKTLAEKINKLLSEMKTSSEFLCSSPYDFHYDQVVSIGEMLSSTIISHYLEKCGLKHKHLDARQIIQTVPPHREAAVDWDKTLACISKAVNKKTERLWLTQGFIGGSGGYSTTLGREGSDFSAAILAWATEAENLTIWKDVPGLLNADPKYFSHTTQLPNISYNEAIELAYYGATVIHPKTIKPLQNKNIPLFVRSFCNYKEAGSRIDCNRESDKLIPSFIFKKNQILISISPRDFSFIVEKNISYIFSALAALHIKVNLMQNSAISFSICIDHSEKAFQLIKQLQANYRVLYNTGIELVTIRHYTEELIEQMIAGRDVLLEQRSRSTCRLIVKSN